MKVYAFLQVDFFKALFMLCGAPCIYIYIYMFMYIMSSNHIIGKDKDVLSGKMYYAESYRDSTVLLY